MQIGHPQVTLKLLLQMGLAHTGMSAVNRHRSQVMGCGCFQQEQHQLLAHLLVIGLQSAMLASRPGKQSAAQQQETNTTSVKYSRSVGE
jgi:hypothetical protein